MLPASTYKAGVSVLTLLDGYVLSKEAIIHLSPQPFGASFSIS